MLHLYSYTVITFTRVCGRLLSIAISNVSEFRFSFVKHEGLLPRTRDEVNSSKIESKLLDINRPANVIPSNEKILKDALFVFRILFHSPRAEIEAYSSNGKEFVLIFDLSTHTVIWQSATIDK